MLADKVPSDDKIHTTFIKEQKPVAWFSFDSERSARFGSQHYPNAFVRFMQRWLLGIYWTENKSK